MADTAIEWAEKVWNPFTGCTKVSAGCQHCYAERYAARLAGIDRGRLAKGLEPKFGYPLDRPFRPTFRPDRLNEPRHWKNGKRIFLCSTGDILHSRNELADIEKVIQVCRECPQHTFLLLSKRAFRMADVFTNYIELPPNVWPGVSIEDQSMADIRIDWLVKTPAARRFISYEPALGPVYGCCIHPEAMTPECHPWADCPLDDSPCQANIDWVIAGGETGPGARPMLSAWVRDLRDQCQSAGVPFFFKSWGDWGDRAALERWRQAHPDSDFLPAYRDIDGGRWCVGKKYTGAEIDGQTYQEFPERLN